MCLGSCRRVLLMRVLLVDLPASDGVVSKDTVVGGYGSRLRPFTRVTGSSAALKRRIHDVPSVHLAYLAGILAAVRARRACGRAARSPTATSRSCSARWSTIGTRRRGPTDARARHARRLHRADGVEAAGAVRAARRLPGRSASPKRRSSGWRAASRSRRLRQRAGVADLDALPFPRWDFATRRGRAAGRCRSPARPFGGGIPAAGEPRLPGVLHLLPAPHPGRTIARARSANIVDELDSAVRRVRPTSYVIFRDPLFTERSRSRAGAGDGIRARGLDMRFECETRLDRLDPELLDAHARAPACGR